MTEVVVARSLTKSYGQRIALDNVSFSIRAGEAVGLVGPNGAGKSTLLRMICGSSRPSSGKIQMTSQTNDAVRSPGRALGFVLDPPGIPGSMAARELLAIERVSQRLPEHLAERASADFGIQDYAKRPFGKLSTGQRQRVALAAATLSDPDLLVACRRYAMAGCRRRVHRGRPDSTSPCTRSRDGVGRREGIRTPTSAASNVGHPALECPRGDRRPRGSSSSVHLTTTKRFRPKP
jgi:ABC-type transport system involved in cytochrome c biogenesis ATPase subunit